MSETEFLTAEELAEVTGYKHVASQREWLDKNGWPYVVNASGRPIVGRWAARMRLARPCNWLGNGASRRSRKVLIWVRKIPAFTWSPPSTSPRCVRLQCPACR